MRSLRIGADSPQGEIIRFRFDGREHEAIAGETLAAALLAAGVRRLGAGPDGDEPRGAFCMMGACQECVVLVADRRVEACRLPVHEGLEARSRP